MSVVSCFIHDNVVDVKWLLEICDGNVDLKMFIIVSYNMRKQCSYLKTFVVL